MNKTEIKSKIKEILVMGLQELEGFEVVLSNSLLETNKKASLFDAINKRKKSLENGASASVEYSEIELD